MTHLNPVKCKGSQASRLQQGDYFALRNRIRESRERKGLSVVEAASLVGVSEQRYQKFEAGQGELPAPIIFQIANAVGIRIIISDGVIADGID